MRLDAADRRILGMGAVITLAALLILVVGALALGLAVRVFLLVSGLGG